MRTATNFMTAALLSLMAAPVTAEATPTQFKLAPRIIAVQPEGTSALQCRGGPVDAINFVQYSPSISILMVRFAKGSKPASLGLEPGQCAWKDRAMEASDPTNLCQQVDHVFVTVQHVYDSQYHPSDLWLLQSAWSKAAPWLEGIRSADKTFGFYVKDEGNNCLAVKGQF